VAGLYYGLDWHRVAIAVVALILYSDVKDKNGPSVWFAAVIFIDVGRTYALETENIHFLRYSVPQCDRVPSVNSVLSRSRTCSAPRSEPAADPAR
jgi:hypothetical protein